jgi:dihydrofolate reductase
VIEVSIISIIPVFLRAGIGLFKDGRPEQKLTLVKTQLVETGWVQLHFAKVTSKNK